MKNILDTIIKKSDDYILCCPLNVSCFPFLRQVSGLGLGVRRTLPDFGVSCPMCDARGTGPFNPRFAKISACFAWTKSILLYG